MRCRFIPSVPGDTEIGPPVTENGVCVRFQGRVVGCPEPVVADEMPGAAREFVGPGVEVVLGVVEDAVGVGEVVETVVEGEVGVGAVDGVAGGEV